MSTESPVPPLRGFHHLSAIVDHPQDNITFYADILGLRLVKQTVNYDDPSTYHFYFGDEDGSPGGLLTFFAWPRGKAGGRGADQFTEFSLQVAPGALDFWDQHFADVGVTVSAPYAGPLGRTISAADPAGLRFNLVERPEAAMLTAAHHPDIPAAATIRGLLAVTVTVRNPEPAARFLSTTLGLTDVPAHDDEHRIFAMIAGERHFFVTVRARPDLPVGMSTIGTIHHLAWRTSDVDGLLAWRKRLMAQETFVTMLRNRTYFTSIYFKDPAGLVYEIATDGPGFAVDEPADELGHQLCLPAWLEERRPAITAQLDPIILPRRLRAAAAAETGN
jgi:glyoxalase family protein